MGDEIIRANPASTFAQRLIEDFVVYHEQRSHSSNTIISYRHTAIDFVNFIGDLPIASAGRADIREYLAWLLEQGASENSIAQKLSAIRAFFNHLELIGVVAVSPARLITRKKPQRKLPHALTVEKTHGGQGFCVSCHAWFSNQLQRAMRARQNGEFGRQ